MAKTTTRAERPASAAPVRAQRLAKGVYGLIVITALIGELEVHEVAAGRVFAAVVATAVVVFLAHAYSDLLAEGLVDPTFDTLRSAGAAARENASVTLGMVVPAVLFAMADIGWIAVDTAYLLSEIWVLSALFVLGTAVARAHGRSVGRSLLPGSVATVLGLTIIRLEMLLG